METQNKFIWYLARISFYSMVAIWILALLFFAYTSNNIIITSFFVLLLLSIILTFILSIIHLTKYQKKGFAVTSLIISSIGVIQMFLGIGSFIKRK